jgi:hypothetical protein
MESRAAQDGTANEGLYASGGSSTSSRKRGYGSVSRKDVYGEVTSNGPTATIVSTNDFPSIKRDKRLKLHWEPGYLWQDEKFERKWCMMYNYEGWPGTGVRLLCIAAPHFDTT